MCGRPRPNPIAKIGELSKVVNSKLQLNRVGLGTRIVTVHMQRDDW